VGLPHTALRRLQHVDCERAGFAQPLHSATYGTNRPAGSAIGKAFATGGTRAAVRRSQSKASEQLFRVSSLPLDSLVSPPNVAPMWPPFCPFLAALHPAVRREDVRDVDTSAREPVNEATAGEPNPGRQGCEFSRPSSKVMVPDAKRKETTVGIEHLPGSAIPSDRAAIEREGFTVAVHRGEPPVGWGRWHTTAITTLSPTSWGARSTSIPDPPGMESSRPRQEISCTSNPEPCTVSAAARESSRRSASTSGPGRAAWTWTATRGRTLRSGRAQLVTEISTRLNVGAPEGVTVA
jgi:hypothetical protein